MEEKEMTLDEIIEFWKEQCEAQKIIDEAADAEEDEKFTKIEKYQVEQDEER